MSPGEDTAGVQHYLGSFRSLAWLSLQAAVIRETGAGVPRCPLALSMSWEGAGASLAEMCWEEHSGELRRNKISVSPGDLCTKYLGCSWR